MSNSNIINPSINSDPTESYQNLETQTFPQEDQKIGRFIVINESEDASASIGKTDSPKSAASAHTIREFVNNNKEQLSSEDLQILTNYSRSEIARTIRPYVAKNISDHHIFGRLPTVFQKALTSVIHYTQRFFQNLKALGGETDRELHGQILETALAELRKTEGLNFELKFNEHFKTALNLLDSISNKQASLKDLKSKLALLKEQPNNLNESIQDIQSDIEKRQKELETDPSPTKQAVLDYLKSELDSTLASQKESLEIWSKGIRDAEGYIKGQEGQLKELKEQFRKNIEEVSSNEDLDKKFVAKANTLLKKKYFDRVKKFGGFKEEGEVRLFLGPELKGVNLKFKPELSDRYLSKTDEFDDPRKFFYRGPDESTIRKAVTEEFKNEEFDLVLPKLKEDGSVQKSKFLETFEQVNEFPKLSDLQTIGFFTLNKLLREGNLGIRSSDLDDISDFISSELLIFLSQEDLRADKLNLTEIRDNFLEHLKQKDTREETFSREDFKFLLDIDIKLSSRPPILASNATNYEQVKQEYDDGTWKDGDERKIIYQNIKPEHLNNILAVVGKLLDSPEFANFLKKVAE
jgi:hypothetical protein